MAGGDRISELPEPILHQILSSLSHKQAIQTTALSKPWRHVGPTRPKIELRERCFKRSCRASFLSVLRKILRRYNHRNLSVHEFILEMSESWMSEYCRVIDSDSRSVLDKWIPMLLSNMDVKKFDFSVPLYFLSPSVVFRAEFLVDLSLSECNFMTTTNDQLPLFKGLKRLSLKNVCIENETLETIIRTCPLIEYLSLSRNGMSSTIDLNVSVFPSESLLEELHLVSCNLTSTDLLLIKRLKTLSLDKVGILEETLDKIMCHCPLIERLLIPDYYNNIFETICLKWYGHDKYFFPSLKSLYLHSAKLSTQIFESFWSNFPSLEELELQHCSGFQEIQLTFSPLKRFIITSDSIERLVMTIHAPNIRYFELSVYTPPRLLLYTETGREWKSHVVVLVHKLHDTNVWIFPWLLKLRELLNALRESQISLDVCSDPFKDPKIIDTNNVRFRKPVPLEHLSVKGNYMSSSVPDFLKCLFHICRPRYIAVTDSRKLNDKMAEFKLFKVIQNLREMSRGYSWKRDLEGISMQACDRIYDEWHTVLIEEAPDLTSPDRKIRFRLNWRD